MSNLKKVLSLVALCVLAGCSSGQQFQSFAKQFPSEQKIDEIKQSRSTPTFRDASNDGRVPHWKLNGPLPTTWGSQTIRSTTPVGQGIDKAFTSAKMTEQMACVARETGIFYAHYERYPFTELREFIGQRCGSINGAYAAISSFKLGNPEATEGQVAASDSFKEWASGISEAYDAKNWEYGVWFGSGDKGTFVMLAAVRPDLDVNEVKLNLAGRDEVVIEGEMLVDTDAIFAVATEGEFDTADCVTSTGVELPAFRITCPLASTDASASISISRGEEGDVFARNAASPRFWLAEPPTDMFVAAGAEPPVAPIAAPAPSGGNDSETDGGTEQKTAAATNGGAAGDSAATPAVMPRYVRPELIRRSMLANDVSPSALRQRFVTRVNAVRSEAGRESMVLEEEQSTVNRDLVPALIGNDDDDLRNQAVLGALAGWKVNGKIINGGVQFQAFYNANVDDMVVSMLASASGRRALLAKDLDSLAIGSVYNKDADAVGLAVTSYEFLDKTPHLERVNTFLDKLAKARQSRGLSPPRKVSALKPLADNLDKRVQGGTMTFEEAANELLNESFEEYQRDTYVYAGAAHDPMRLTFNEEILSMEPLRISIMVTPFKPEGSPWYTYGVVITYPKTKQVTKVAVVPATKGTKAPAP